MLFNILYRYGWYKQRNVSKNGVETIADDDEILWLHEKHIEQVLDWKNLRLTIEKYNSDHRKYSYELVDEPKKKQSNRIFTDKELAMKIVSWIIKQQRNINLEPD